MSFENVSMPLKRTPSSLITPTTVPILPQATTSLLKRPVMPHSTSSGLQESSERHTDLLESSVTPSTCHGVNSPTVPSADSSSLDLASSTSSGIAAVTTSSVVARVCPVQCSNESPVTSVVSSVTSRVNVSTSSAVVSSPAAVSSGVHVPRLITVTSSTATCGRPKIVSARPIKVVSKIPGSVGLAQTTAGRTVRPPIRMQVLPLRHSAANRLPAASVKPAAVKCVQLKSEALVSPNAPPVRKLLNTTTAMSLDKPIIVKPIASTPINCSVTANTSLPSSSPAPSIVSSHSVANCDESLSRNRANAHLNAEQDEKVQECPVAAVEFSDQKKSDGAVTNTEETVSIDAPQIRSPSSTPSLTLSSSFSSAFDSSRASDSADVGTLSSSTTVSPEKSVKLSYQQTAAQTNDRRKQQSMLRWTNADQTSPVIESVSSGESDADVCPGRETADCSVPPMKRRRKQTIPKRKEGAELNGESTHCFVSAHQYSNMANKRIVGRIVDGRFGSLRISSNSSVAGSALVDATASPVITTVVKPSAARKRSASAIEMCSVECCRTDPSAVTAPTVDAVPDAVVREASPSLDTHISEPPKPSVPPADIPCVAARDEMSDQQIDTNSVPVVKIADSIGHQLECEELLSEDLSSGVNTSSDQKQPTVIESLNQLHNNLPATANIDNTNSLEITAPTCTSAAPVSADADDCSLAAVVPIRRRRRRTRYGFSERRRRRQSCARNPLSKPTATREDRRQRSRNVKRESWQCRRLMPSSDGVTGDQGSIRRSMRTRSTSSSKYSPTIKREQAEEGYPAGERADSAPVTAEIAAVVDASAKIPQTTSSQVLSTTASAHTNGADIWDSIIDSVIESARAFVEDSETNAHTSALPTAVHQTTVNSVTTGSELRLAAADDWRVKLSGWHVEGADKHLSPDSDVLKRNTNGRSRCLVSTSSNNRYHTSRPSTLAGCSIAAGSSLLKRRPDVSTSRSANQTPRCSGFQERLSAVPRLRVVSSGVSIRCIPLSGSGAEASNSCDVPDCTAGQLPISCQLDSASAPLRRRVAANSAFSKNYDAFSADPTWFCVFCGRRSHSARLGDLLGPCFLPLPADFPLVNVDSVGVAKSPHTQPCMSPTRRNSRRSVLGRSADSPSVLNASATSAPTVTAPDKVAIAGGSSGDNERRFSVSRTDDGCVETWFHQSCLAWCDRVVLIAGRIEGVTEAVLYSRDQVCWRCCRGGATVGCFSGGCRAVYHVPCLLEIDGWLDESQLRSYCRIHRPTAQQSPTEAVSHSNVLPCVNLL